MKLWTKEGVEASEKGLLVVKEWVRKNRHHPTIKMTPIQILDLITIIEQGFDDIKFYLPRFEEMQKTLEWYADPKNNDWKVDSFDEIIQSNVMIDDGERARQALKGETK